MIFFYSSFSVLGCKLGFCIHWELVIAQENRIGLFYSSICPHSAYSSVFVEGGLLFLVYMLLTSL